MKREEPVPKTPDAVEEGAPTVQTIDEARPGPKPVPAATPPAPPVPAPPVPVAPVPPEPPVVPVPVEPKVMELDAAGGSEIHVAYLHLRNMMKDVEKAALDVELQKLKVARSEDARNTMTGRMATAQVDFRAKLEKHGVPEGWTFERNDKTGAYTMRAPAPPRSPAPPGPSGQQPSLPPGVPRS